MAKLHYLNKYFFCVSAKVENDCLKYGKSTSDMPYVTFSEKGVQIRKKLKKEDIVNLVPEPRIIHVSFYPHSPIVHLGTIKITTSSVDDAVVRNELLDRIKQCYIKEIETEAKSLSLDYEISFIEGEADSDGIKLRKYTPRIESALDKILSESKK